MSNRISVSFTFSKSAVRRGALVCAAALLSVLGYVAGVRAAIPADADALTYTGVLIDNGAPVIAPRHITVTLFADAGSSQSLCTPFDQQSVSVTHGRFTAKLDASCVTAVHGNASAVVEVKVDGAAVGARTPIGAVPFAVESGHAGVADSATNATTATRATSADAAADVVAASALRAELDGLHAKDAATTAFLGALGFFAKGGNDGSLSCDGFCQSSTFGPVGGCIGGVTALGPDSGLQVGCTGAPPNPQAGGDQVVCLCAQAGANLPPLP